ncbi:MAG: hemerythrin domain-containing protein [Deltaproteobacteria bacterium]|nr:hemerythrin domain-containing protein [Deltaproteobacteria bacterium]
MQPIGPLMHEHRLIERMVAMIGKQAALIEKGGEPNTAFIADAVDFFRVYADRCHHGKEEELLFKDLANKGLNSDLITIMNELIEEHRLGRSMVDKLHKVNQDFVNHGGDAKPLARLLIELSSFYPKHIEKEDKHFFFPVMDHFSREEMDKMLEEFHEFDRQMIHDFFGDKVKHWEEIS